jgi:hypothetical protein
VLEVIRDFHAEDGLVLLINVITSQDLERNPYLPVLAFTSVSLGTQPSCWPHCG